MSVNLNNYSTDIEPPTFFEILSAARDSGLVGEDDTLLTLVLAMIRGNLVVMTGPARAGKDECVDAAEAVYRHEEMVYKWPVDDSETAAYYNRDEINQYPVHRFPDLARIEDHHEKILKAFGEGRDATRNRTDMAAEKAGNDPVEDQVIECPETVIAFIASDNKQINLDDYPELRNRALTLSVDASEEQTKRVNRRKAEERQGTVEKNVDPLRKAEIQDYHMTIPVDEWANSAGHRIVNPMAVEIHNQEPIPEKFPEARQDFDRLLEFMETVALYHYANRMTDEYGGERRLYVTPRDVWEAMTIIGNKMVMSALNLTREDRAILELLKNSTADLTKAEIQQSLRSQGFHVADDQVRSSLDSMREKGYVRVHQDATNTYSFNEFGSVVYHDVGIDYGKLADYAAEEVYELASDDKADLYVDRFCGGEGMIATHPFTGRAVNIEEDDTLETMMEEGISGVEDVFEGEEEPESEEAFVNETLT